MSPDLTNLRILLVHEWLYTHAGAERVLEELSVLLPHADVVCGAITPQMRATHDVARRARETWLGSIPGARSRHRWFVPLQALAFSTLDTRGYDVVLSISHSFGKMARRRNGAKHICYCLTPPRYLWDMRDAHEAAATPMQRLALRAGGTALREVDRMGAARVDEFISISRFVADRVKRCYGRDSTVVYPPVRARSVSPTRSGVSGSSFLLTMGRLVPYKRVDLAVRAAEQLGMRLVVAGDGPERKRLERLGGRHTEFWGDVSEETAAQLLDACTAFVFCAEEDFGIAPLEANAHGKPVVALRRGGATETLVEGVNAVFFERQEVADIVRAVELCLNGTWSVSHVKQSVARFAPEHFREHMRESLVRAMAAS